MRLERRNHEETTDSEPGSSYVGSKQNEHPVKERERTGSGARDTARARSAASPQRQLRGGRDGGDGSGDRSVRSLAWAGPGCSGR